MLFKNFGFLLPMLLFSKNNLKLLLINNAIIKKKICDAYI